MCGVSAAAIALGAFVTPASAADRWWDPNGSTSGSGGSGDWNTTASSWSQSNNDVLGPWQSWDNVALDNAIFGTTPAATTLNPPGTITLTSPITVHDILFQSRNGWVLSGGTLTLAGTAGEPVPTITTDGSATISSIIAGTSGLIKEGASSLTLTGANSFSGGIFLNRGTLSVSSDAALGDSGNSITIADNAGVAFGATAGQTIDRTVTIGSGSTVTVSGGAGSAFYTGSGNVRVSAGSGLSNDSNTYTGTTTFLVASGSSSTSFTSIGNLGEASALGAPTTVESGTISWSPNGQYSDNLIYLGDGDSSNRNWTVGGNHSGSIVNDGTGALILTGAFAISNSSAVGFNARKADLQLLGVIGGSTDLSFTASALGDIILAGSNSFTGKATIGGGSAGNVFVSVLADSGVDSSLGAGSQIGLGGVLHYTGSGASTDRTWTAANGTLLNGGTGALELTGDMTLTGSLTLGGTYGATNTISGAISGTGDLASTGSSIWELTGANTRTGAVTLAGGTLRAGSASALGTTTRVTVDGGTLDLNGFDLVTPRLDSTGGAGTIALGGATLTVDSTSVDSTFGGAITGSGALTKSGLKTLTLTGSNTYSGPTNVEAGTLKADFSLSGALDSDILSASSTVNLSGGGILHVKGAAGETNSQAIGGLNIVSGANTVRSEVFSGGTLTIDLGTISRVAGMVNFDLVPNGSGNVFLLTDNPDGALGGWAMIDNADYAKVVSGRIVAFDDFDYTDLDDASQWDTLGAGQFVSDDDGDTESFSGTLDNSVQLAGLHYDTAANSTVTIAAGQTLGVDGAILVTPNVGNFSQTIQGGSITGSASGVLAIQHNGTGTGRFTIDSRIVDNGAATGFTKGGSGTVRLTGTNGYTGATTLSGGTLQIASLANGGVDSAIGASDAGSANLVLEGGTLHYVGAGDAVTDRGFTLVNAGLGVPAIQVDSGRTVEFQGQVTSTDDQGLTKIGSGRLTLSNGSSDYIGATTIGSASAAGGTLSVDDLANGGLASGIGASSADSSNLFLQNDGELEYTGATVTTDRGFTLGAGGGAIDVTQSGTSLTFGGTAIGTGGLTKTGAGTLILCGSNSYTGGTRVSAGTLEACSTSAFGTGAMAVDSGGTLDLAGLSTTVRGLNGAGRVILGSGRLTTNGNGSFSGTISGTGGVTVDVGTQTMSGCTNDYTGVTRIEGAVLSVGCLRDGNVASDIGASDSGPENLVIRDSGLLLYTGGTQTTDRGFTLENSWGYVNVQDSGTTLTFTGDVVGSAGSLVKRGQGTLVLSGTNSYGGHTQIEAGTLRAGSASAFGTGGGYLNLFDAEGAALDMNGFDANFTYLTGGGSAGGNVLNGGGTLTLNLASGGIVVYAGTISGSGGLVMDGQYWQRLTNCESSYTGATTISRGILEVGCLADGGVASAIGQSTNAAGNLIIDGGMLRYLGAATSTDRLFTLGASTTSKIEASGTGALAFTNTGAIAFSASDTAQTIRLGGSNTDDNSFALQITDNGDGKTSLAKEDAGTWILTNQESTYTGVTSITGGVLGVDKLADGGEASSIGRSAADATNLVIGTGSTLRYTGAGDSTDRLFTLSVNSTTIESSGSGAIEFTSNGLMGLSGNGQRTLSLSGSNGGNNVMGVTIRNQSATNFTSLAKNGAGKWILTGNNSYTGNTNVNQGTLVIGDGATSGSIASLNSIVGAEAVLGFNRSDAVTYAGTISGEGELQQLGTGTTILTGTNTYTGGTTIAQGILQLGNGGTTGSIVGNVANEGTLAFDRSDTYQFDGTISGSGSVTQAGTGTTVLSADNDYTGGTTITSGTLQVGDGGTFGSIGTGDVMNDSALVFSRSDDLAFAGLISGGGTVSKLGAGTLTLTGDNSYTGVTTIAAGTLQVGDGGTSGTIAGDIVNDSALIFNRSDSATYGGGISGSGSLTKLGSGTLTLSGSNSHDGPTTVAEGTLLVDGVNSGTGLTSVASGATLGGSGAIGGDVDVQGTLAAGSNGAGTLTIGGNLQLGSGSTLDLEFGAANSLGSPLNDLIEVGGDLALDGTLNVSVTSGGNFGAGIYRVFNYGGTLTDNGLAIGAMPMGSQVFVQTSVAGQVNLVNTANLTLNFWDGDAGPKFDSAVNGGDGVWQSSTGNDNWTDSTGVVNAPYADGAIAIFTAAPGTVTVDNSLGAVTTAGMQFAATGYVLTGDALTLSGTTADIRVGDGSAAGAGYTATIANELGGSSRLVKTDLGTLILAGDNSYTGGTTIAAGTLRIGHGGTSGSILGDVANNGTLVFDRSDTIAFDGTVSGTGGLEQAGTGTTVLTADQSYTGATTITSGTLQVGDGGTTGSIIGDVTNNGTLTFDRSGTLAYAGAITGTGALNLAGGASYSFTGESSYSGDTIIDDSSLLLATGGSITTTGTTGLAGPNSVLTVNGAGSVLTTGTLVLGSALTDTATVNIEAGGVVATTAGGLAVGSVGSVDTATVNISGAGSLLDLAGSLNVGLITPGVSGIVNVSGGGAIESIGGSIGTPFGATGTKSVTIEGTGSRWTNSGALDFYNGSLSLLDGGTMTAASATMGAVLASTSTLTVSGVGSDLSLTGGLTVSGTGTSTITLADGGRLGLGGPLTLANSSTSMGILNIGGAEGQPEAAAGLLDAAELAFGPGTGRINFNHIDTGYAFATAISGAGSINQVAGVTNLTGDSSAFTGTTAVSGGTLLVDGALGDSASIVNVATGGTLGGEGVIGGDVAISDGTLSPGSGGVGTLTIDGDLSLAGTARLAYDFGQSNVVGGPLNDLVDVGGDLTLDGTIDVTVAPGGSFDIGLYRVINYGGALTNNGLDLGTMPPDSAVVVQTAVAGQVNLVNSAGLALNIWDGDLGPKDNGAVNGGDGTWHLGGSDRNWTGVDGAINAAYADGSFAIFPGTAGTVSVDNSAGAVTTSGMQFATGGYVIGGAELTLVGSEAVIRVGEGTAAGAAFEATISADLTGASGLVKTDLGTLILAGDNRYAGGTAVAAGMLQVGNGGTTGSILGDVVNNGALSFDRSDELAFGGLVSGSGSLSQIGSGTLILSAANSYSGATDVASGTLLVNGDQSAATGLTSVASGATLGGTGTIGGDVAIANGGSLAPGSAGAGTITINGALTLGSGSSLDMEFGQANTVGGALNDLIQVAGDLVLDGALNVSVPPTGAFGPGIYRVIDYGGTLTDNGLSLGIMPAGSNAAVQTAIAGQVNLLNTGDLALSFWDGAAGPQFDGVVNGGDGTWQSGAGNSSWTDSTGVVNAPYADGTFAIFSAAAGTVTVDNSLGAVTASGMQFASDGYVIAGEELTLVGPQATIRVGDGTAAAVDFEATISADLSGASELVKTDAGTLILSGTNSYSGGTAINGGTLRISSDSNLGDLAGGVSLDGGTLATAGDLASSRDIAFVGSGAIATAADSVFTFNGLLSGAGAVTKEGAGTWALTADNSAFAGPIDVAAGTLDVGGIVGSAVTIGPDGRLEGTGHVASAINNGAIAPGSGGIGTLTIDGDYSGGGTLEVETVLGDDGSETDRLVVAGATSGTTAVHVVNRDGLGAKTAEGIKIIDVAGASDGTFTLDGDYLFQGEQAIVAGAYAYTLEKNGVSTPADGDWYLRSELKDPVAEPETPLYQPGVPVYEAYSDALLALNELPTWRQRIGGRKWASETGLWGRVEVERRRADAIRSTGLADVDSDLTEIQAGLDRVVGDGDGGALVLGITGHYREADAGVRSVFGNGGLKISGYGIGATLSWYGSDGLYVDAQAQATSYKADLDSTVLGELARDNGGDGHGFGIEVGQQVRAGSVTLTPQAQLTYSSVDFDRFADAYGAMVSSGKGESLKARAGLTLDHPLGTGSGSRGSIYGLANLHYELLDGSRTVVSGTSLSRRDHRAWGEIGLGANYGSGRISLFGEMSVTSALNDLGDSYSLKGEAGVRLKF